MWRSVHCFLDLIQHIFSVSLLHDDNSTTNVKDLQPDGVSPDGDREHDEKQQPPAPERGSSSSFWTEEVDRELKKRVRLHGEGSWKTILEKSHVLEKLPKAKSGTCAFYI